MNDLAKKALLIVLEDMPSAECFDKNGALRYDHIIGKWHRAIGGLWLDDFYFPRFERAIRLCVHLGIIPQDHIEITRIGYYVDVDRVFPADSDWSDLIAERLDRLFKNKWETDYCTPAPSRDEILSMLAPQPVQLKLF